MQNIEFICRRKLSNGINLLQRFGRNVNAKWRHKLNLDLKQFSVWFWRPFVPASMVLDVDVKWDTVDFQDDWVHLRALGDQDGWRFVCVAEMELEFGLEFLLLVLDEDDVRLVVLAAVQMICRKSLKKIQVMLRMNLTTIQVMLRKSLTKILNELRLELSCAMVDFEKIKRLMNFVRQLKVLQILSSQELVRQMDAAAEPRELLRQFPFEAWSSSGPGGIAPRLDCEHFLTNQLVHSFFLRELFFAFFLTVRSNFDWRMSNGSNNVCHDQKKIEPKSWLESMRSQMNSASEQSKLNNNNHSRMAARSHSIPLFLHNSTSSAMATKIRAEKVGKELKYLRCCAPLLAIFL